MSVTTSTFTFLYCSFFTLLLSKLLSGSLCLPCLGKLIIIFVLSLSPDSFAFIDYEFAAYGYEYFDLVTLYDTDFYFRYLGMFAKTISDNICSCSDTRLIRCRILCSFNGLQVYYMAEVFAKVMHASADISTTINDRPML